MIVTFICLLVDYIGEPLGGPFVLRVPEALYLAEVAEAIKTEITDIQVPAYRIDLWKPVPPLSASPLGLSGRVKALHLNVTGNNTEAVLLGHASLVGNEFLPHLPLLAKHINIIAKLPSTTMQVQPSIASQVVTPTFDINIIDQQIEKELQSLHVVFEKFITNSDPPIWVPSNYAALHNQELPTDLQVSLDCNGKSSHDLHVHNVDEIKKYFRSNDHLSSGSEKVQHILESLTKCWGFYFVIFPDGNGIGIQDLKNARKELPPNDCWKTDPPNVDDNGHCQAKSWVLTRAAKKVLAARIVAFQLFLKLVIKVDKKLEEKHKCSWLFFQLSNPQVSASDTHPIVQIMNNCLHRASNDALDNLIQRLDLIREKYIPYTHFIVGMDKDYITIPFYPL